MIKECKRKNPRLEWKEQEELRSEFGLWQRGCREDKTASSCSVEKTILRISNAGPHGIFHIDFARRPLITLED
jgi:hypothetical protein